MESKNPLKQSPYEQRLRTLVGFLNAYKEMSEHDRAELRVDALIVRLVKNDSLLWGQIEHSQSAVFSEN